MAAGRVSLELDEKKIDAIFGRVDQSHLPGAAVGIAIAGKPVYRKGFGLASMELPMVLTPRTRMRIYSTTKHFTCLAYMLLCEEGKAGVDDPIGKYLSHAHAVTRGVTMRHLMTNTSGLRDACEIRWMLSGIEIPDSPSAEVVGLYRQMDDVNFQPGAAYCYNNAGFHILTAAIEQVCDETLDEVFRTRIFQPVGMYDTMLRRRNTDFVPDSATMHMMGPDGKLCKSYLSGEIVGEGGVVSTVNDMLRWMAHMDHPIVGNPETWRLMKTPARVGEGRPTGYGMGLLLDRYRGVETVSHAGGALGSNSQMIKVPSVGLDIAIMANRHDVSATDLANEVIDASIAGLAPCNEEAAAERVTAIYQSPTTGHVVQLGSKDGRQTLAYNGGWGIAVERSGERHLTLADGSMGVRLLGNGSPPDRIRLEARGWTDELAAVDPVVHENAEAIVGTYRSPATGTDVLITLSKDEVVMRSSTRWGSTAYRLCRMAESIWQASMMANEQWGGLLIFNRADPGFCFFTGRTWNLPFRRE